MLRVTASESGIEQTEYLLETEATCGVVDSLKILLIVFEVFWNETL